MCINGNANACIPCGFGLRDVLVVTIYFTNIQGQNIEREVKKATRDLSSLLHGMESPLLRLEAVQKKYTELLADMKRLDRENVKSKKRADQVQKERDQGRSELSKTVSMKEKLEKLCRELTRENKKMKACTTTILI